MSDQKKKEEKPMAKALPELSTLLKDAEIEKDLVRVFHKDPEETLLQIYDRTGSAMTAAGFEVLDLRYITSNPTNYLLVRYK